MKDRDHEQVLIVSCSSCGCHTKWPPPTCLLRRLITPGYRPDSISLEPAIYVKSEEEVCVRMKWNSLVFTDLNLTSHTSTQNYVSVHLTQSVICHLLNHHVNRKKNKTQQLRKLIHQINKSRSSLFTSYFINHPHPPQPKKIHLKKCIQGDLCEMK